MCQKSSPRVPRSSSLGPQGLFDHVQGLDLELAGLREGLGHELDGEEQAKWYDVLRHVRQDHHFVDYWQKKLLDIFDLQKSRLFPFHFSSKKRDNRKCNACFLLSEYSLYGA